MNHYSTFHKFINYINQNIQIRVCIGMNKLKNRLRNFDVNKYSMDLNFITTYIIINQMIRAPSGLPFALEPSASP